MQTTEAWLNAFNNNIIPQLIGMHKHNAANLCMAQTCLVAGYEGQAPFRRAARVNLIVDANMCVTDWYWG